jgi:hypothetical protein
LKCLTIPEKLAVMRMCVWGIDVASFCNFIIGFRNVCIFQPGLFSIPQGFICPFHLTFNNSYSFIYPSTFWHKMSHIFVMVNTFIYTCHFKINSFSYWFVCIEKRYLLRNYFLSSGVTNERCINYWRVDTLSQTNNNLSSYLNLKLFNSIISTKIKLDMK